MFIGHFGIGFGSKAAAPGASLGSLFLASQFIDLLWPTLLVLAVELLIFGIGVGLYLRTTEAADNTGVWAFWILVILLLFIYLGNVFGSPPPNVTALAWIGEAQWILILWGYWIDRHRKAVEIIAVRRIGM